MAATQHVPVLAQEVIEWFQPAPGRHSSMARWAAAATRGCWQKRSVLRAGSIALDRDPAAVERAEVELGGLPVVARHANYSDLPEVLATLNVDQVDGILLDLGLSSDQLADPIADSAFTATAPLDLRFDPTRGEPAWKLVERLSAEHLADLIYRYGEERFSRRIARRIVETRRAAPINTAADLARVVRAVGAALAR